MKEGGDEARVEALRTALNDLPLPLARTLVLRGVDTFEAARSYFRDDLTSLHDPLTYKGMQQAVERITGAMRNGEAIVVYGDYDVDGTTATALLTHYLLSQGANASFFVPDRFRHGYGLSRQGLDAVREMGAKLIIALDCGVTAVEETTYARECGMDLVICDHHTPQDVLPDAVAVLDAKREDDTYPFKELCGCGVTFKLVQALHAALGKDPSDLLHYLDLVAVATTADMVPLTGENRVLVREGLHRLRYRPRIGLRMLADQAGAKLSEATTRSIGFYLGPRINAAGRLGDAARAVNLLLADDQIEATARARQLERLNEERRALDRETQQEAFAMADRFLAGRERHALVLHHPDWHLGVIGIVASRLVERHYRPAVMLTTAGSVVKGSARSTAGINVYAALTECQDLLLEYGGHDYAAGLTLEPSNLASFIERFDQAVARSVNEESLEPFVEIDAELRLSQLDERFWAVLKQFEPFGQDNPAPVFLSKDLEIVGPVAGVGRQRDHVKFSVRERGASHPARNVIGFGLGKHLPELAAVQADGRTIELLFSVEENTWNGRTSLQLNALDLRPSSPA
ncbi:MAG: single-stranded-DNA-specific exonuclease RecJ [Bacteroidetes bacterium]|nr:single-stranded-DNA-specific exonuclease RecJ [Bacteroidota bacterium]